jgi:hypothetical protein
MNLGFYLTGSDARYRTLARAMIVSARMCMTSLHVEQFSDMETAQLDGVDSVTRRPSASLARLRSLLFASVEGEWLFVDSDIYFRGDVRGVFRDSNTFDIAIADRNWNQPQLTQEFLRRMPFNVGVIFSRSTQFWRDVHAMTLKGAPYDDAWFGDQIAINDLVRSGAYRVKLLDGSVYNYPPRSQYDVGDAAKILHFKGQRKQWMPVAP